MSKEDVAAQVNAAVEAVGGPTDEGGARPSETGEFGLPSLEEITARVELIERQIAHLRERGDFRSMPVAE